MLINIVGGLFIGMIQHGLSFGNAIEIYTILTIGDGLVAQFLHCYFRLLQPLSLLRKRDQKWVKKLSVWQ